MSDVLVIFATRMGATREIAEVVADELRAGGLTVDLRAVAEDLDPASYRAVVLGSAIYLRRWRPDAMRFLHRHRAALRHRPVWLFQSGPIDPDTATRVPWSVRRLEAQIGSRAPVMSFGGRLDRKHARGPLARWLSMSADLCGDARDWDAIPAWARRIHDDLRAHANTSAAPPRARD
jgi:menaquinone-dependent protoporphyrinogen oxidase